MTSHLREKSCEACEGIGQALTPDQIQHLLPQVDKGWEVRNDQILFREFKFKNFYETMAFVNAIAWIANQENHHPDLEVGYNYCRVQWMTHALQGLSQNDFICAAKIDHL